MPGSATAASIFLVTSLMAIARPLHFTLFRRGSMLFTSRSAMASPFSHTGFDLAPQRLHLRLVPEALEVVGEGPQDRLDGLLLPFGSLTCHGRHSGRDALAFGR